MALPPQPASIPQLGLQDAIAVMDDEKTELDKIIELMLDPKNIGHLTELTRNEILAFSVLSTINKRYDGLVLGQFLKENLIYRVSKGRKGRLETVKLTSRQLAFSDATMGMGQQPGRGGFSRWFGRRR